ncbi:MAG TPA: hypothetical protein VGO91_12720 [Pyrinomonadaceae bacterium]|jgi:hypothetical protein|nr:hypothetical protein [Pyrinomonadaceae bacterium]
MSDYLWDKSGEPDAEVERLEELFKDLRYQPRELELPLLELPLNAQLAHAPGRNYWPGLAAAALILMGLAGFWLVQHRGEEVAQSNVVAQANQATQETQPTREANAGEDSGVRVNAPQKVDQRQADSRVELPRRQALPHMAVRRRQELVGPQMVEPKTKEASPDRPEVADVGPQRRLEQQREREQQAEGLRAKEELMLALQVASTKLNHAQRKARGGTSIPGPDSKPAAPARIPWNKSR